MSNAFNKIIDTLLDMKPDPIPYFILLKDFKKISPYCPEYLNAYDRVCEHPFVRKIEKQQNEKGFWIPFHAKTESMIRKLLWYGLDVSHSCLVKARDYTEGLLLGNESHDRYEVQDNVRWWTDMFMPLCVSATLSTIDNDNVYLEEHRKRWAHFTQVGLIDCAKANKKISSDKTGTIAFCTSLHDAFDREVYASEQREYFRIKTKNIIEPFNYYCLLLLAPGNGKSYLSDEADQAMVDYGMNYAKCLYYIYNGCPGEMIPIDTLFKDGRHFHNWIRALSLISQFKGWVKYKDRYVDYIISQRNQDGLWEFPKKYDWLGLSDTWHGNNRAIDSTIFVLRMLMKKQAL